MIFILCLTFMKSILYVANIHVLVFKCIQLINILYIMQCLHQNYQMLELMVGELWLIPSLLNHILKTFHCRLCF